MNTNRISQLQKFIQEEPDNPFLIYALAMEYIGTVPDLTKTLFDQLLKAHPSYLPTYYHAAGLYAEMGQRLRADKIYQNGIDLAKKTKDLHALKELRNAYSNFLMDV